MTKTYIIVAAASYLLGSIPFGYILVKLFLKQDIRATGSGNIGATNVARSGAKGLAIATLILDALKGALSVLIAANMAYGELGGSIHPGFARLMAVAALMSVLGHMFPVWLGFKGGKGVATAVGAFAVMSPLAILCSIGIFASIVALTRYVSVGSIAAAVIFPFLAVWEHQSIFLGTPSGQKSLALVCLISLLVILKHHENIRRLLAGTEDKFSAKKPAPPDVVEKQA